MVTNLVTIFYNIFSISEKSNLTLTISSFLLELTSLLLITVIKGTTGNTFLNY